MANTRLSIADQKLRSKSRQAMTDVQSLLHSQEQQQSHPHDDEMVPSHTDQKIVFYHPEEGRFIARSRMLIESIIRNQNIRDVLSKLSLIYEIIQNRMDMIVMSTNRDCPEELIGPIVSIIYCSKWLPVDVPELHLIRKQFKRKYGKAFINDAVNNTQGRVSNDIVSKLPDGSPVQPSLIDEYLSIFREQQRNGDTNNHKQPPTIPSSTNIKSTTFETSSTTSSSSNYQDLPGSKHSLMTRSNDNNKDHATKFAAGVDVDDLSTIMNQHLSLSDQNCHCSGKTLSNLTPVLPYRTFAPNPNLMIAFDVRSKNPVYVLERLVIANLSNSHTHSNNKTANDEEQPRPPFYEETALPEMYRSRLQDYFHSGYDRGHMAPAADFVVPNTGTSSSGPMKDTFTMCNVCPQIHSMNVSIWLKLENWCRRIAREEQKLKLHDGAAAETKTYVVTGPLWLPLPVDSMSTSDKNQKEQFQYTFPAIGGRGDIVSSMPSHGIVMPVHVPTHFFKVIVVVTNNVILKFACFVMPNSEIDTTTKEPNTLRDFVVKWTDLESMSGLQLFPNLTSTEGWKDAADMLATAKRRTSKSKRYSLEHLSVP